MDIRKYRAWIISENRMVEVFQILFNEQRIVAPKQDGSIGLYDFTDIVLMQSIGLKDIHNREIFELDLVTHEEDGETWSSSPVVFENGMFCFKDDYPNLLTDYFNLEIIGDLFRTPELNNNFKIES